MTDSLIRQAVMGNHRWVHRVCYTAHTAETVPMTVSARRANLLEEVN